MAYSAVTTSSAQVIPGGTRNALFLQNKGAVAIRFLFGNVTVTADNNPTTAGLELAVGAMMMVTQREMDLSGGVSAIAASATGLHWQESK